MTKVISFFMTVLFAMMNLIGFTPKTTDLEKVPVETPQVTEEHIELFRKIFVTETAWLASLQIENGAIPMTKTDNGQVNMNPYFADFAALALLDNADEYADEVKSYMDWHFAHLNTRETDYNRLDGTIYDYTITMKDGKIEKEEITYRDGKKSYDSTDSYAATFLSVLNKYLAETGDSDYIISHAGDIERIVNVIFATMSNNLTYLKPDQLLMFLMDNCEVYDGLMAAAELFEHISNFDESYTELFQKCADTAVNNKEQINKKFWNKFGNNYASCLIPFGIPSSIFSWDQFYPEATCQLFPITYGIIEPDTARAHHLYNKFCETYDWENFNIPDAFYWGANLLAAVYMNDLERVVTYMENYEEKLLDNHKYPLYNADSARVAMSAYIMLEKFG